MKLPCLQPLGKTQNIAVVEQGSKILSQLNAHASQFSDRVRAAGSATEECEREVEQEQQVEQEMQQDVHYERAEARCETDWDSWKHALQCNTLQDFTRVSGTQVC
jgi:hypothetical protein